jgi:peptide-methionine (S)-S-oxide reductase
LRQLMITFAVLLAVGAAAVGIRRMQAGPRPRETTDVTEFGRRHAAAETQTATFAAGCFWKLEAAMRRVEGAVSTTSGYTGGTNPNVTHATLGTGTTGHAEAVRVVYDPGAVSYERLLDVFWSSHDPAQFAVEDGEPPPPGRSIVFYHTDAQRAAAEASKQRLQESGNSAAAIPTEIAPAVAFCRAEAEHQQYHEKHGRGVCAVR